MKMGWSRGRVGFVTLVLLFACSLAAQETVPTQSVAVPALSGTVVDAFTGKPISGVDVILRAERRSWSNKQLRYENCRTSKTGRFQFSASTDSEPGGPFGGDIDVSLSINKVFISVSQLRASGEEWRDSDGSSDVSYLAMSSNLPGVEHGKTGLNNNAYFPASAHYFRDCDEQWNVTCFVPDSLAGVRIPLIPVLSDPGECRKIEDLNLRERCRQINTFRAAFLHVDTFAQLRQAKEICKGVDHGGISQNCLERLHNYVRELNSVPIRPSLLREYEPFEKVLIVTPPAGLELTKPSPGNKCNLAFKNPRFGDVDPFEEKASYFINYQREGNPYLFPNWGAMVCVAPANTPEERKSVLTRTLTRTDWNVEPVLGKQIILGNTVSTLRMPGLYLVIAWASGSKVVSIQFNYLDAPTAAVIGDAAVRKGAITPEMEQELIRAYIQKYPSSN